MTERKESNRNGKRQVMPVLLSFNISMHGFSYKVFIKRQGKFSLCSNQILARTQSIFLHSISLNFIATQYATDFFMWNTVQRTAISFEGSGLNWGWSFKKLPRNKLRLTWGRAEVRFLALLYFKYWITNRGGAFFCLIAFRHLCYDTQTRMRLYNNKINT